MTGLLPFINLPFDVVPAPYLTRDFLRMKLEEKEGVEGILKRSSYYAFLLTIGLVNKFGNSLLTHFNKRGIVTCYWVLNNEDEILYVANETPVMGILTDKP
jgi:hypothetical protein